MSNNGILEQLITSELDTQIADLRNNVLPNSVRNEVHQSWEETFHSWEEATLPKVVAERVKEEFESYKSQELKVKIGRKKITLTGVHHSYFEGVLNALAARDRQGNPLCVALIGAPGVSKTRQAMDAARASNRDFVIQPFNPQMPESRLFGYMNATGEYVPTAFYDAFVNGKVYIADEFDTANPAVAVSLNTSISNRIVTFPNGETREAHKDFQIICCMNTHGTGATETFTARLRLDVATLDRFVFIEIPLDESLESALVGVNEKSKTPFDMKDGGRFKDEQQIIETIRKVRQAAASLKLPYTISPRTTLNSIALHDQGFGKHWIFDWAIYKGMNQRDRENIEKKLR